MHTCAMIAHKCDDSGVIFALPVESTFGEYWTFILGEETPIAFPI